MIVILSNSLDATTDYVCSRLDENLLEYVRLNTDQLIQKTKFFYKESDFWIVLDNQILKNDNINCVWLRRPKPLGSKQERGEKAHSISEWSAAIEGFLAHIPLDLWINHPSFNALASSKLEQLSRARKFGLRTPKTLTSQSFEEIKEFWRECQGRLVVKPISHGFLERDNPEDDTLIFTNKVTFEQLKENRHLFSLCPTLFQEKIEKNHDVRINVVDKEIVAVAIYPAEDDALQAIDIRRNNMKNVRYELIKLPDSIRNKILELCRSYCLRFAAIDMVRTRESDWVFLEINPNGQWAWLDLEGVTDIAGFLLKSMQFKI